jgi:purine nucleosidase
VVVRVVIDTDGGIDDAVALWWAVTHPRLDVVGITTVWGNVDVDVATANVLRVLEAAGRADIPVARGVTHAVGAAPILRRADFVHGADGLGNTDRPEARRGRTTTLEQLWRGPGATADTLITLGPLATVATALGGGLITSTGLRLVVMGGTFATPGNALPVAEANIAHDPSAASAVLAASWAEPPLLVGLDVTHQATFRHAETSVLERRGNPAASWLADPMAFYRAGGSAFVPHGENPCHDLLAVMAAVLPGLVDGPVLPVSVQCHPGPAWGMTVADRRGLVRSQSPNDIADQPTPEGFVPARVALTVDVARFRSEVRKLFS